ncbi:MAG: DUF192 domain-containing protein [Gemmatimonadota bacterium]
MLILLLVVAACERGGDADGANYADIGGFDTTTVQIITASDTFPVKAEVAATPDQHQLGLMERTQLGADAGMIFVYDQMQDANAGFWMYRTRIPLDIAFIDAAGAIVSIRNMQPCESPNPQVCPTYSPTAPYLKALEVNQGYFARHGIQIGDRVVVR